MFLSAALRASPLARQAVEKVFKIRGERCFGISFDLLAG